MEVLHIQRLILKGRGLEKRPYDAMYRLSYSPILRGYGGLQRPQKYSYLYKIFLGSMPPGPYNVVRYTRPKNICVHCALCIAALTPTLCMPPPPLLRPSLHPPLVAGDIDEWYDCRKSSHMSVKNQKQSGVTAVTSTLAIGTDG